MTKEQRRLAATMNARDRIVAALLEHGDPKRRPEAEALARRQAKARRLYEAAREQSLAAIEAVDRGELDPFEGLK